MDIYQYDDFKLFLRDLYEREKSLDSGFSYRKFAHLAEIKNPGYLLDVIKGKRRLSENVMVKAIEIFKLKPLEEEFFRLLVKHAQCKKLDEKEVLLKQILNRRNHSNFVRLNPAQSKYYEDTNYALVIAAIEANDFRGEYKKLGSFLEPPLAEGKVKKYVRELCEWGFIKQNSEGRYSVIHRFLEPPETLGSAVKRMNKEWLLQAPHALFKMTPEERHISTVILTVSTETKKKIRDKIEAFRREVFDLVNEDKTPEEIMQLSMVYYPKSRKVL